MDFKTIDQINFSDKKALIRVDYNVPIDSNLESIFAQIYIIRHL